MTAFKLILCAEAECSLEKDVSKQGVYLERNLSAGIGKSEGINKCVLSP